MKKILSGIFTAVFPLVILMHANHATADVLPINPGLWESTVTSTNSMTGTQTKTSTECLVEDSFDPASMMDDGDQCQLTASDLDGDTLTFSMECNMEGGESTMTGVYQTDGETGQGTMNMEMSFGGQTMTMESNMTTVRLGDC